MRDLFGNEVTMEMALALKRMKPPSNRKALVALRTEKGVHPHNGMPLGPTGETCGSCKHCRAKAGHAKNFYKCAYTRDTAGPATDLRVRWPACSKWEMRPAAAEGE